MKKIGFFSTLILAIILITGCGSAKTLTCTMDESEDGIKSEQKMVIKFKDNKASSVKATLTSSLEDKNPDEETISGWKLMTSLYEMTSTMMKSEGIKITTDNDEKNYKYEFVMDVDLEKVSEDEAESLEITSGKSYEDAKKELEEQGYTCK